MNNVFRWVTKSSVAVALFGGWGGVTVTVNEAEAISEKFDIKFGINKACAGYQQIGEECRDTTYTVTVEISCGNTSSYDIPGSVCWPVYGFVPDDYESDQDPSSQGYTCDDYSSCDSDTEEDCE